MKLHTWVQASWGGGVTTCGHTRVIWRAAAACVVSGLVVASVVRWHKGASGSSSTKTPVLLSQGPSEVPASGRLRMAASGPGGAKQTSSRSPVSTSILSIAATTPTTQPAPSEAAQAKAEKLIHEVYLADYRQTDPSKRQTLAAKLFQQALEAKSDPTTRFVLLRESRDLAASAGDAAGAAEAIELLRRDFGVDSTPMSIAALTTALGAARSPQSLAAIIQVSLTAADRAVAGDDYAGASRLTALAAAAAARARDEDLTRQVRDRSRDIQRMAEQYDRVKAARDLLRTSGRDAECNLIVGRYLCFIKGDFANGLPLLAEGSDPALREAAHMEIARPSGASGMLKLANQWWDIAETQNGLARMNLRQHAGGLFRQAIGGLSGSERSVAEKRLGLLDAEEMQRQRLTPGIHATLFKGIDFVQKAADRVDTQIDFDWASDAPDPSLPKDNFSLRWNGRLKVSVGGRYELVAIANAGTCVWIDEQLVIDAPDITRQRNGIRRVVELPAGLHALRVDYWDTSGTARMRLLWRPPAASRDEPIPASSFYHEAGDRASSGPSPR